MKTFIILFFASLLFTSLSAQDDPKTWYDFWIGKWEVTWDEADGKKGRGINTILRTLNNAVIQENFSVLEGASTGYLGTSISVYNPQRKQWHQGYADSQGAYFNFIGEKNGDTYYFKTQPVVQGEKEIILRMKFYNITKESLMWDWESTQDGGKNWNLNWRISYKRMKE